MKAKQITPYFIIVVLLIVLGYDFWAYNNGSTEGTISWYIYDRSHEYPLIPFATGVLCGHFFWNLKKKRMVCGKCGYKQLA